MESKLKIRKPVNWNHLNDEYSSIIWNQNVRQFWVDEEIALAKDKEIWNTLSKEEQYVYKTVLSGLTLLDTEQGNVGMPSISREVESLHSKAILSFMGTMEQMHAKSYSSIFTTFCNSNEIDKIFSDVEKNKILQEKINLILNYYNNIKDDKTLYLAMCASVFLESFMFYSGFFYPLYLTGQGKMTSSGEIINLIIRDEAVHGVYTGLLAKNLRLKLSDKDQEYLLLETINLFKQLYVLEKKYTEQIYKNIGLVDSVTEFLKYNANKAFDNLGLEDYVIKNLFNMNLYFEVNEDKIGTHVIKGLNTETKNHDFFSVKGNGYVKATKVEDIDDDDFF